MEIFLRNKKSFVFKITRSSLKNKIDSGTESGFPNVFCVFGLGKQEEEKVVKKYLIKFASKGKKEKIFHAKDERRFALERKKNARRRRASRVKNGYETLAFGGIEDAVRLLFAEELKPEELEVLDLYNVAEIRRPKGGGMEIKFFDRLKALECLERLEAETGRADLFEALEAGARAMGEGKADGD